MLPVSVRRAEARNVACICMVMNRITHMYYLYYGAAHTDTVPSTTSADPVTVEPAPAEQEALDASYKSGESPYDVTTVGAIKQAGVEDILAEPSVHSSMLRQTHTIAAGTQLAAYPQSGRTAIPCITCRSLQRTPSAM